MTAVNKNVISQAVLISTLMHRLNDILFGHWLAIAIQTAGYA